MKTIKTREIMKAYKKIRGIDSRCSNREEIKAFNSACEKLEKAIKEAEGRATARTLTAEQVCERLYQIDLQFGITKKALEGTEITVNAHAQDFPRAYRYTPESTFFRAVFKRGQWEIYDIYRDTCRNQKVYAKLPDTAKAEIIAKYAHHLY